MIACHYGWNTSISVAGLLTWVRSCFGGAGSKGSPWLFKVTCESGSTKLSLNKNGKTYEKWKWIASPPMNESYVTLTSFIRQMGSWDDSITQNPNLPVSCCRNPFWSYQALSKEGRCYPWCRVAEMDESPSKESLPSTAKGDHLSWAVRFHPVCW